MKLFEFVLYVKVITQSINEWEFYYICNIWSVSIHSHASSVPIFNGLNFFYWCEQGQFHLGVLDLESTLQVEKPIAITDTNNAEEK